MAWGIKGDTYEFCPEIYSFRVITLAPVVLLIGYLTRRTNLNIFIINSIEYT